jgi:pilus assembly protein Flp/PilA
MNLFSRFKNNESGATAIEYALIAAIIGIGLIVVLGQLRGGINNSFTEITDNLNNPAGADGGAGGGAGGAGGAGDGG